MIMQPMVRTQELRFGRTMEATVVRKSKTAIFWEKNPNGIIKVNDRRAVNK